MLEWSRPAVGGGGDNRSVLTTTGKPADEPTVEPAGKPAAEELVELLALFAGCFCLGNGCVVLVVVVSHSVFTGEGVEGTMTGDGGAGCCCCLVGDLEVAMRSLWDVSM